MVIRKVKLGGYGHTVEIDESKFGRRKHHRGHRVEGQWVFGGYERETGNVVPVEKRDATTLLHVIKEWIKPGTTIISDCWKAYNTLNNEGYVHMTVNHRLHFKDPETGVHSNSIETSWRHAKASMSNYCRKKKIFPGYLAKHMSTKHCRIYNLDPTAEFFKNAGTLYHKENENVIFNDGHGGDDDGNDDDDE
ncbi:unnamed protein product [Macrosiphum euphorbiae]|uniref:ISXO2-like transposase domain-containing protein n=1 Tax=Macrosiphum euphorbiae TaxID=13131 RepID=A0AAV0VR98_9HEMI|nr:unnamed protein product [Macrosiphum euphorbiae]